MLLTQFEEFSCSRKYYPNFQGQERGDVTTKDMLQQGQVTHIFPGQPPTRIGRRSPSSLISWVTLARTPFKEKDTLPAFTREVIRIFQGHPYPHWPEKSLILDHVGHVGEDTFGQLLLTPQRLHPGLKISECERMKEQKNKY